MMILRAWEESAATSTKPSPTIPIKKSISLFFSFLQVTKGKCPNPPDKVGSVSAIFVEHLPRLCSRRAWPISCEASAPTRTMRCVGSIMRVEGRRVCECGRTCLGYLFFISFFFIFFFAGAVHLAVHGRVPQGAASGKQGCKGQCHHEARLCEPRSMGARGLRKEETQKREQ